MGKKTVWGNSQKRPTRSNSVNLKQRNLGSNLENYRARRFIVSRNRDIEFKIGKTM